MKDELLAQLMTLFRTEGYDGASLSEISRATGLGKSSLYHHFAGGKAEMATAVLAHLDRMLAPAVAAAMALDDDRATPKKVDALLAVLDAFYEGGRAACLLERLTASVDRALFAAPLAAAFASLLRCFQSLARQAGHARPDAERRAEDAMVTLQGALVVAAGTNDAAVFRRALVRMRATLLG